jgi:hypothetical protein
VVPYDSQYYAGLQGLPDTGWKAKRQDDEPCLYSAENNMDPGDIPDHLATLTPMEEMIIA